MLLNPVWTGGPTGKNRNRLARLSSLDKKTGFYRTGQNPVDQPVKLVNWPGEPVFKVFFFFLFTKIFLFLKLDIFTNIITLFHYILTYKKLDILKFY